MFQLVQKRHHLNLPLSALTKLLHCLKRKEVFKESNPNCDKVVMKHPETSVHGVENPLPFSNTNKRGFTICAHEHYTKLIFLFLTFFYLLTTITDIFLSLQLVILTRQPYQNPKCQFITITRCFFSLLEWHLKRHCL